MVGIYFSGTGNTRFCIEQFMSHFNGAKAFSIESADALAALRESETIIFGYPTHYSNLPKNVRDFVLDNISAFKGKKVFVICTMGLMSGDGAGCVARLLKKHGVVIIGGLHLKMPDCVGDVKLLKKPLERNRFIVKEAGLKITHAANRFKQGKPPKQGLGFFSHILGLVGQRVWFAGMVKEYKDTLKIDKDRCVGCGRCVSLCPMENLRLASGKAESGSKCAMCYRCISRCPEKAITLLGKEVVEQSYIEKYI